MSASYFYSLPQESHLLMNHASAINENALPIILLSDNMVMYRRKLNAIMNSSWPVSWNQIHHFSSFPNSLNHSARIWDVGQWIETVVLGRVRRLGEDGTTNCARTLAATCELSSACCTETQFTSTFWVSVRFAAFQQCPAWGWFVPSTDTTPKRTTGWFYRKLQATAMLRFVSDVALAPIGRPNHHQERTMLPKSVKRFGTILRFEMHVFSIFISKAVSPTNHMK